MKDNSGERVLASLLAYIMSIWLIMLMIGVIHAHILPTMIACGFWPTGIVVSLFCCACAALALSSEL